jgi:hypothetical protein
MASKSADIQLKQIALAIRNVASAAAPRKTGNLRNELRRYNTPERMIKTKPGGEKSISFSVAPPGAVYGKYWNFPYGDGNGPTATIKKRYPQHFDYGDKALKDPAVRKAIEDWKAAWKKEVIEDLRETIRYELGTTKR